MSLQKQFEEQLNNLWQRRTAKLRCEVVPRGRGKQLTFNRTVRNTIVDVLLDQASEILVRRDAKAAFADIVRSRHLKQIRGRGVAERAERLLNWARETLDGPIIYSFWRHGRCLYVGKSGSWHRLRNYQRHVYIDREAHSIKVFQVKSLSYLAQAECLAIHLFSPRYNIAKASRTKWGKACPICKRHDIIRDELINLCRIR